jgi:heptosyltransferase II
LNVNKFLVIQTAFPGDVILATPVLEKLKRDFPSATIDMLVRKGNESLFSNHPFLRKVLIFNKKANRLQELFRLIKVNRKEKYDLLINLQRFTSSGIITIFSGAKNTVGFRKNPLSRLFTKSVEHQINPHGPSMHETQRNLSLLSDIGNHEPAPVRLYPSGADFAKVREFQQKPYICIAPMSVWFTKQFPRQSWTAFIGQIPEELIIYILGAKSDRENCEKLSSTCIRNNIRVLAGELSFLESAALMQGALMNYCNDSAPTHLASAVNAPVTAIFCSTVPEFGFGPLSSVSHIVETTEHLSCRPCGIHGFSKCPEGHFKCATTITTEMLTRFIHDR